MSAESEVRKAWAAFVEKAKAAEDAGFVLSLPKSATGSLGVSATAKALDSAPSAPVAALEPVAEPETPKASKRPVFSNPNA